jgi:FkbM family methyltransferase
LVLVDIGAKGGLEPLWRPFERSIFTVDFEPDDRSFHNSGDPTRRRSLDMALWERSEPLTLYCARDPGKTSVLPPNMERIRAFPRAERFETADEVRLPAERVGPLDDVLATHGIDDVDFIKVDTQGSELPILRGGAGALSKAVGVKVEVEFFELYRGQPLFADVDKHLRAAGYQLIDLRRTYWKRGDYTAYPGRGQLVFGDALYFRDLGSLFETLAKGDRARAQDKVMKLVAACLVYGIHDYAMTALDAAHERGLIDDANHRRVKDEVVAYDRRRLIPEIPQLRRILKIWRRLERRVDRGHENWGHSDSFLGNR